MIEKPPPQTSVHIIVVRDYKQKRMYYEELRKKMEDRGYKFYENRDNCFLAEGDDEYRFLTPDEPDKLLGLRVSDFEEKGDVYEHPKLSEMREAIDSRIF